MRLSVPIVGFVVVAIAIGAIGLGFAGVAAQETDGNGTVTDNPDENRTVSDESVDGESDPAGSGRPLGTAVAAFVQSNAAATETRVDDGMYERGLERAETAAQREELLDRHTRRLETRLERLEQRREGIEATTPESASAGDVARAARVHVGATELARSLERSDEIANQHGLPRDTVVELRQNVRSLEESPAVELVAEVPAVGGATPGNDQGGNRGPESESHRPDGAEGAGDEVGRSDEARGANGTEGPDTTGGSDSAVGGDENGDSESAGSDRGSGHSDNPASPDAPDRSSNSNGDGRP